MNNQRADFAYEISDERLIAYGRIPLLDRLRWLDEVRRFTLMVRNAPTSAQEDVVIEDKPNLAR